MVIMKTISNESLKNATGGWGRGFGGYGGGWGGYGAFEQAATLAAVANGYPPPVAAYPYAAPVAVPAYGYGGFGGFRGGRWR
jgi:hypothetical protein